MLIVLYHHSSCSCSYTLEPRTISVLWMDSRVMNKMVEALKFSKFLIAKIKYKKINCARQWLESKALYLVYQRFHAHRLFVMSTMYPDCLSSSTISCEDQALPYLHRAVPYGSSNAYIASSISGSVEGNLRLR
jgi:hypothetical protein